MNVPDQASRLRQLVQQRRTRTIAVASGKGGVGKSCVATNLAICLSAAGKRVALFDADLSLANLDILMDVTVYADVSRVIDGSCHLSDVVLDLPSGIQFVPGASGLAKLAHLTTFEQARLVDELTALEADNDVIVIDCGAGIGPEVLCFAAAAQETLVVTTPEPTAMTDAYALVKVLSQAEATCALSIVTNQARSRQEGREASQRIVCVARDFLAVDVRDRGWIPADPKVRQAVRQREPVVLAYPTGPASRSLADIAADLDAADDHKDGHSGFFHRVAGWFSG